MSETFTFNFSNAKIVVTKKGESKGNIAKWFAGDKKEVVEGNIIEFEYDGSIGTLPTKIFDKNFTKVED